MSFPPGTEMFQFPGFASPCLCIQHGITCSLNFSRPEDQIKFNEEVGFPHSEICGSKVAHTSPQLIAACHVLHRLCMPRHPPNALTSRLKIRTTNDITVSGCTVIKRNTVCIARPKAERRCCGGRWGIESPSNRLFHGIVQKNPFTMSRNCQCSRSARQTGCFILEYVASNALRRCLVEPIGIEPMTSSLQS